jgi:hypothetical protein
MAEKIYDRKAEDLGNIVNIGHVNFRVPDQRPATSFYITGLGLTRDPYLNTGVRLMWVNIGMSQFHLPTGGPDVLRGATGIVLPSRAELLNRLTDVNKLLEGTEFGFRETNDCVEVTCPWGNRFDCHEPDESRFGRLVLGIAYVQFDVRPGTAAGIARFYQQIMGAPSECVGNGKGREARVQAGDRQFLVFKETDNPERPYDGDHIQIFISNFSGPYNKMCELGLISMEANQHEWRFKDIVDLETREILFTVEHEVRSQTHPMFGRPLINRNPNASNRNYKPGHDSISWAMS